MIKFFRKIRQGLLTDNKFSKYLLYAIGEIVLVVIGILIALAINRDQEFNKDRETEISNLIKFSNDLVQDSLSLQNLIAREQRIEKDIDTLYNLLLEQDEAKVLKVFDKSSSLGASSLFNPNTGTYDEAVATGTMQTLLNDSLRRKVFAYYRLVKNNLNDRITDEYQTREIVPVLVRNIATTREAVQLMMPADNPYLKPLSIKFLVRNPEFNQIMVWRKANGQILRSNWRNFLEENASLKSMIESEIKKKKAE